MELTAILSFGLAKYEIEDIANLALANPISLFIETPYPLHKIIDWIGQAQLLLEIDSSKISELRNLSIRTSLDFLTFGQSDDGKRILGRLLHPIQSNSADDTKIISERLRTFGDKAHVRALREMIEIIRAPRVVPPVGQQLAQVA